MVFATTVSNRELLDRGKVTKVYNCIAYQESQQFYNGNKQDDIADEKVLGIDGRFCIEIEIYYCYTDTVKKRGLKQVGSLVEEFFWIGTRGRSAMERPKTHSCPERSNSRIYNKSSKNRTSPSDPPTCYFSEQGLCLRIINSPSRNKKPFLKLQMAIWGLKQVEIPYVGYGIIVSVLLLVIHLVLNVLRWLAAIMNRGSVCINGALLAGECR